MNLEHERNLSKNMATGLKKRYSTNDDDFFPIRMITRWDALLNSDPLDFLALKKLVDEALPRKNDFELLYFTFCTHIEGVIKREVRDSFKPSKEGESKS